MVQPGGALTSAAAYVSHFTHNQKGIIVEGVNLVLGGYQVVFDMQGHGAQVSAQSVAAGGKVTKPADPTAQGWLFKGWYTNVDCTTRWNFSADPVNSNMTLFAKWEAEPVVDPPKTGDDAPIWLWASLLVLSALMLLGAGLVRVVIRELTASPIKSTVSRHQKAVFT